jgi:hypothetical protein
VKAAMNPDDGQHDPHRGQEGTLRGGGDGEALRGDGGGGVLRGTGGGEGGALRGTDGGEALRGGSGGGALRSAGDGGALRRSGWGGVLRGGGGARTQRPYFVRRRERIREEIERNRRGDFKVPTWVLALALVLLVAGWAVLVLTA